MTASLPAVVTARGIRRGPALAARRLLFDVKTIHAGTGYYVSAHARDEQAGAVRAREAAVDSGYRAHARALDVEHHGGAPGPVLQRLQAFGTVRGLVFGAYSEASADVHDVLAVAATESARTRWEAAGARSIGEYRAYLISSYRRRVGLTVAQAFARHRLARVPYIGVPRSAVERVRELRERDQGLGRQPRAGFDRGDSWFQWQSHGGRDGGADGGAQAQRG